jgi:hypothetical protein
MAVFDYTLKDALRQALPTNLPRTSNIAPGHGRLHPPMAGYMLVGRADEDAPF